MLPLKEEQVVRTYDKDQISTDRPSGGYARLKADGLFTAKADLPMLTEHCNEQTFIALSISVSNNQDSLISFR